MGWSAPTGAETQPITNPVSARLIGFRYNVWYFTALIPQITVVFPSFTSAEPSAVEMDPKRRKTSTTVVLTPT